MLRTCGWGSGNSAVGSSGTSGKCKYTDAGLLHLGSSRSSRPVGYGDNDNITNKTSTGPVTTDDLDCGIEFASRPKTISFWYKYSPKNSADKGYAEIWIKDANGNLIGEVQTMLLENDGEVYTQKSFTIAHTPGTPKAAKIYVKFLSSYSMDFIKRTNDNFSGPGFANLSDGKYLGSQLYIDDIELTY